MFARVLLPLALVLALAGTAAADKAKLAVLGLEVAGSIDTDSTSHGRLLTEHFRARIAINQHFTQAPNSMKDLLDEKVANGCDTEAPDCMSKIGGKLKASYVMFGKIEKRPKDGKEGYQLSMKFLDVDKKSVKEWGDWVPLGDFVDTSSLDNRVATAFDMLTKDVTGVGAMTPIGPTGPNPVDRPKSGGGFPWKATAIATSAVTLVALGGFAYYGFETRKFSRDCKTDPDLGMNLSDQQLKDPMSYLANGDKCSKDPFTAEKRHKIAGVAAAAVGGLALFAVYKGFIATKKESSTQTGSRVRKKKQFAVTPIVSPEGGGATFRLDW